MKGKIERCRNLIQNKNYGATIGYVSDKPIAVSNFTESYALSRQLRQLLKQPRIILSHRFVTLTGYCFQSYAIQNADFSTRVLN
jgi:hypothetical protein